MDDQLRQLAATFEAVRALSPDLARATTAMVETLEAGGCIFVCGNGGSAAEGQHFVTELVGRYKHDRAALPSVWLGGDTGQMTCIANDFSWNDVFARPLRALAREGDLLLALSTSGRSSNVVAALDVAGELGLRSIALLGEPGNMQARATIPLTVGPFGTARVQEAHLFLIHCLCDGIEAAFPAA
ncbi:SIS domain-containing protein [Acuticoccus sp. MNP-M23]|uniref:D-sedoheptulose-7-phosphate isomerase n=1 Tax=Acuticoccus sp. MNP-M23 TaxID=3072793 RepID=UPI0028169F09|nr:SIS domain-containing protein [Acuticoccus sp. MNP-M23]WMS41443.1 SIS domain-containing protein [Acuticoccus sp. MNP-M23]